MHNQRSPDEIVFFLDNERHLWMLGILFFVGGDLGTTWMGLTRHYVVEVGPVVAPVIHQYGTTAMVGLKTVAIMGCVGLYSITPKPHNVGVPLGLAVLGILVTIWNLALLVATTL